SGHRPVPAGADGVQRSCLAPVEWDCWGERMLAPRASSTTREWRRATCPGRRRIGPPLTILWPLFELAVDYISGICYVSHITAHLRGRLRSRAEGGAGSGVLRRRLVTA